MLSTNWRKWLKGKVKFGHISGDHSKQDSLENNESIFLFLHKKTFYHSDTITLLQCNIYFRHVNVRTCNICTMWSIYLVCMYVLIVL